MKSDNSQVLSPQNANFEETEFEGFYGTYKITPADKFEVQCYRISVLVCGIAFSIGIFHWLFFGPNLAWLWLVPIAISLGLALKWIHIYLRPLHKALQILWAFGCLGLVILIYRLGSENVLANFVSNPTLSLAISPLFAALTGLGFKEFFCFRRLEAIGLTLLVPIALLGHLSRLLNGQVVMGLLALSSILLLFLGVRKFGMDVAADIGDKSVFDYLDNQQTA